MIPTVSLFCLRSTSMLRHPIVTRIRPGSQTKPAYPPLLRLLRLSFRHLPLSPLHSAVMHVRTNIPYRMQDLEALSLLQPCQSRSITRTCAASSMAGNSLISSRSAHRTQMTCERQELILRCLFDMPAPSRSPRAIPCSAWPCESATPCRIYTRC
ncbi:hypothetical protein OE88DRAFT_1222329 [Heliocybe sulcata]|uniref:Uncharacterized protein n=1 Tax=Heliocybe sulcata TaxID=5364 RepID=A0A5C3MV89_9AGAM|nr:hypothetical protein OE88DRAFT_1222329 [Heliocybe sulcata]